MHLKRRFTLPVAASLASLAFGLGAVPAHAAYPPNGTLVGTVHFSGPCDSNAFREIGVGVAFDGANLWYTCFNTNTGSPDLLRADPKTGLVSASYTIDGGLGAIAYDATRNAIWAAPGGPNPDRIWLISLDASQHVTSSAVHFTTAPGDTQGLDDGVGFDATDDTLYFKGDAANPIHHYKTDGTKLGDITGYPSCLVNNGTSGLAIGGDLLYEGKNGCSHVYVVDKHTLALAFDFSTAVPGDPNFRDEGLTCDNVTFAPVDVMWSKEAYDPMRASAFAIPKDTCGVGGKRASTVKTTLSGGGQSGATITVNAGTPVHDSATLTGPNAAIATSTVTYNVYSDNKCTVQVATGGTKTVVAGVVPDSDPVTLTTIGTYYWLATYSGDAKNAASDSGCGTETETVIEPLISAGGINVSATEGQAFTASVATITDPDANSMAAEYTASINWGDGTAASAGVVTGPKGGPFTVTGTHTYPEEGIFKITVTITDVDSPNPATATSTATVADAALTGTCVVPATASIAFAGATATFSDQSTTGTLSDFTATISWGDGTSSAGVLTGGPGVAPYTVSGTHAYAAPGFYTISTAITDVGGSKLTVTCPTQTFVIPPSTAGCDIDGSGKIKAANGDKAKFLVDFGSETGDNDEDSGNDEDSQEGSGNHNGDNEELPENVQTYRDLGPLTPFSFVSTANLSGVCNDKTSGSIYGTGLVDGTTPVSFIIDVTSGNAQEDEGDSDREGHDAATYRIRLSNGYDSGVQKLKSGHISVHLESDEHDNHEGEGRQGD